MFISMQNINFITQFSLSILKLFETFLAITTKINGINSYISLMFICKQTINFICAFFLEILQRNYKSPTLDTFGIPGWDPRQRYYQLVENFHVYLHAKNIYPLPISWNITLTLQTCYFEYFAILDHK